MSKEFNLLEELQKIADSFDEAEEWSVWDAFIHYPCNQELWDDDVTLKFSKDAYEAVKGGHYYYVDEYDLPHCPVDIKQLYTKLLQQYGIKDDEIDTLIYEMMQRYYYSWIQLCENEFNEQGSQDNIPTLEEDDTESDAMAVSISALWDWDDSYPLYKEFGIEDEEKEHLKALYWFESRKLYIEDIREEPYNSGRKAYETIVDLKMLIWLAASAGVETDKVRNAALDAQSQIGILHKCRKFREHIPFELIVDLLTIRFEEFMEDHPVNDEQDSVE